jgi:hypothetical protein
LPAAVLSVLALAAQDPSADYRAIVDDFAMASYFYLAGGDADVVRAELHSEVCR